MEFSCSIQIDQTTDLQPIERLGEFYELSPLKFITLHNDKFIYLFIYFTMCLNSLLCEQIAGKIFEK